jgi:hypothetical protein
VWFPPPLNNHAYKHKHVILKMKVFFFKKKKKKNEGILVLKIN